MEVVENKGLVYEFGRFILDPHEKTLFSDGVPIHLPAREFETLLLLVEHNGRALSKDEMMSALWPDAFVEESNLAKQISKLRKILNSKDGRFIETLPKHGYRFSADLRVASAAVDQPMILRKRTINRLTYSIKNETQDGPRALLPKTRRLTYLVVFAGLAFLGLLGLAGFFYLDRQITPKGTRTIAILPIKPLGDGENGRILGIGLTDALITKLGGLKEVVVRPTSAISQFANAEQDPVDIGRRLKVSAVLEGTIMQADGRLRVNMRLLNTQTGEQIWGDKLDSEFKDIFDAEDRISEQVGRALTETLTSEPGRRVTKRYTQNSEAFNDYLKGRYFWNKRSEDGFRKAIGYFDQAVAKDPNYALAYSGLADCYILLAVWGAEPPDGSLSQAKDAALKALAADAELAEPRVSLAFVKWVHDWDFDGADAEFRRAIELNPNYATAHHWYAYYLVSMERFDEALASIKRAEELEGPLSLGILTDIGEIYLWSKQYDKAAEHLEDVIKIEPDFAIAHYVLGMTYLKRGQATAAIAEFETSRRLEGGVRILSVLGYAYGVAGEQEKARGAIAELMELSNKRYVSPFSIAVANAGLRDNDAVMQWLEKAYAERSDAMAILRVYPLFEEIRAEPRFVELEKRVGLIH
jgi:DNA-binding winged helix-turn-helix (wHTH) protein/TolB-like protein/Tfp pilus assembly protein PilF